MTSIDDIFRKPSTPDRKRKFEPHKNPNEIYKSAKLNGIDGIRNGQASVSDETEEDDAEAGPELPPDFEDEAVGDEEGRFFGGGITRDTADVLDFIDERDQDDSAKPEKIDAAWVRRLALNFEKRISKNAELRAKYDGDPQKFMGSEADLDADIKGLSILSEHPALYQEFAKLGCVASLVSLLSHENTDIAIDAIEIIEELTDEDVSAEQDQWDAIVDAMLEVDLLDLLFQNISRLDESIDSDRAGVFHILGILENLSSRPSIASQIGSNSAPIPWLVSRAKQAEKAVSQNRQYATEVLAILLQSSSTNRTKFLNLDGTDAFLQLLAPYRRRDPEKGTEEEEFFENLFDCITCCVDDPGGKDKFLKAEGVELCLIMLKEGKMSRTRALRLLDHACGGPTGAACAEHFVEAGGLSRVFTIFMKKHDPSQTAHLLSLFSSLLRLLPTSTPPGLRVLAKFVEDNYAKLSRVISFRRDYVSRLTRINTTIASESATLDPEAKEEMSDEWLSRRLDAGLFELQSCDAILAWVAGLDDGAREAIERLLGERDESLRDVKRTLEDWRIGLLGEGKEGDEEVVVGDPDLVSMLEALVERF
ncbi:hypothetical protein MMC09_004771 [Bachmanniomyces sp. S44760]|nr:hypothetical protein [Bachmanniomyces sp. S44760]